MKRAALTKESILDFLRENKDLLKNKFAVEKIMLFGSYARGEAGPDSDIDILIEAKQKSFRRYADLIIFLEDSFDRKVDVIYRDSVNPFIMELIEGEIIYA